MFYTGPFDWSANGSAERIEEPHAWLELGHLELLPSEHRIGVIRTGTSSTQIHLNGWQYGISDHLGRVFVITDAQKFEQVPLNTSVIKNEEDLKRFSDVDPEIVTSG